MSLCSGHYLLHSYYFGVGGVVGTETKNQEKEKQGQLHKCKARCNLKTCDSSSTRSYDMAEPQTHSSASSHRGTEAPQERKLF